MKHLQQGYAPGRGRRHADHFIALEGGFQRLTDLHLIAFKVFWSQDATMGLEVPDELPGNLALVKSPGSLACNDF